MFPPQLLIFETAAELHHVAAAYWRRLAQEAVEVRGRFLLVLAGGSTPKPLYRRMAQSPYREDVPWSQTHVFWGDERMTSPEDPESNYGQARETLLSQVPVPPEQVHPVPGKLEPEEAALAYGETLARWARAGRSWPRFDLVLLGLGSDGHTASLFPGSTGGEEEGVPARAVHAEYGDRPADRVTLTPPVFNSARQIFFLVTGEEKAEAVAGVLDGEYDPGRWPAQRIRPEDGRVSWLVDRAAATQLVDEF
ncbi:MAG: 6-phosphogluconolactonase [Candidatus Promineifilaceae bacterium]|nr:6-phosphogluconolactonase [Candidatus Promineifilaceae bacterium]